MAAPDTDRPRLAQLLRFHRDRSRLSQKALSQKTGGAVSLSHIGLMETGDRNASFETARALAEALGLSPDETVELLEAAGHIDNAAMLVTNDPDTGKRVFVSHLALPTDEEEQLLADAAEARRLHLSADGVDLEELRQADPEAYEQLMGMARIALERAKHRRTGR